MQFNLRMRIMLGTILVAMVGALLIGTAVYITARDRLMLNVRLNLSAVADSRGKHIDTYLAEQKRVVRLGSTVEVISDALQKLKAQPDDEITKARLRSQLQRLLTVDDKFITGMLLDEAGRVVVATDRSMEGLDCSDAPCHRLVYDEPVVFGPFYDADGANAQSHLTIAAPVQGDYAETGRLGTLVVYAENQELMDILDDRVGQFETGRVFLIDEHGQVLHVCPKKGELICSNEQYKYYQDVLVHNMRQYREGEANKRHGVTRDPYQNMAGEEVFGAHVMLEENDWVCLAEVHATEVLRPITSLNVTMLLACLLAAVIAYFFSKRLANGVVEPIQELEKSAKLISEGDFEIRLNTEKQDELGRLATEFNRMARHVADSRAVLDQKVTDRTAELNRSRRAALSLLQDVDEQRRLAQETLDKLRSSNEELRNLTRAIEYSPVSVVVTDTEGVITYVNPKFTEVTGYTSEEAVGQNPSILQAGVQGHDVYDELWEAIKNGEDWHGVFCNKKKDGSYYWEDAYISPVRDDNGNITHYVAVKEDITKRLEVEAELQKLALVVRETQNAIVITDKYGQIEWVNAAFERISEYTFDEVVGKKPGDLLQGVHTDPTTIKKISKALQKKQPISTEMLNYSKSGRAYWLSIQIQPVMDEQGELQNFIAIESDITQKKKGEKELAEAKNRAESANRAKSLFLANMSHEIRTPMNAILGFAQLMRRDPALTPEQQKDLDTIMDSGKHLLALINDILEMSKIEAGRMELIPVVFDLHKFLDELYTMFKVQCDKKGLDLIFHNVYEMPRIIVTDQGKLRQILINLLGNAVKFTKQGSVELFVALSRRDEEQDDDHHFQANCSGFMLYFAVTDTGCGISKEEGEKVFDFFEQTDSGRKSQTGTGLGVAISKEYVRMLGGKLDFVSEVGAGTTFRFDVAADSGEGRESELSSKPDARIPVAIANTNKPRILVADDKADNRNLLCRLLENVGFMTCQAMDGKEALVAIEREQPDLCLLDLAMPGMNGFEVIEKMKNRQQSGEGLQPPVIVVTAKAFEEDRNAVMKTGAVGYLRKPVESLELFEQIRDVLDVEYVFDEDEASSTEEKTQARLDDNEIAKVPQALRADLSLAVDEADLDSVATLLSKIKEYSVPLADHIETLIEQFDYESISELLVKE